jgi:predicted transcriptional regulator
MRRNPERWPASIACRLRPQRALLWDRCAIEAAARNDSSVPTGSRRRSGADSDGLITCLACGRQLRSLGYHLHAVHGTNAVDYRADHLLPASTTLVATGTRTVLSQTWKALIGERPELLERLRANLRGRSLIARSQLEPAVEPELVGLAAWSAWHGSTKARAAGFTSSMQGQRASLTTGTPGAPSFRGSA